MENNKIVELWLMVQIASIIAGACVNTYTQYLHYKLEKEKLEKSNGMGLPERKTKEMFGVEWPK